MSHGAPTTQAVAPPLRYPVSMILHVIADPAIAALVAEEERLAAEAGALRDERRDINGRLGTLLRLRSSAKSDMHRRFDDAIGELHNERRRLLAALEEQRDRQSSHVVARDEVVALDCAVGIAGRACGEAVARMQAELQKLQGMGKERGTPNNRAAVAAQRKLVEECKATVAAREGQRAAKETELVRARIALNAALPDLAERQARDAEMAALRVRLSAVLRELDALNEERRSAVVAGAADDALDETRDALGVVEARLQVVEARLAEIRSAVYPPSQAFTYNPAFHAAVIGRGGATLRQLQEDFGVAICVDAVPPGHGFVVGGAADAAACVEAVHAIVQDEAAKTCTTSIALDDPALRRELLGPRGAVADGFQEDFNVDMQVSETGVVVTGRCSSVAEAAEAIRLFIESFTQREMSATAALLPVLLGRGGRTVRRISDDSGVRSLRVDRESCVVRAIGSPDAIERAFEMCRSAMGDSGSATRVVHADDAWVAAVIGSRGTTVHKLEEESGARIQCTGTTITIQGSPEEVQAAHDRVMLLRREERAVPVDNKRLFFLTSPIVSVSDAAEATSPTTAVSPTVRSPTHTRTSGRRGSSSGGAGSPGGSSFISPLEAVRRASQCDQIVPLRAEHRVVLRGSSEATNTAYGMLKALLRHNEPFSIDVVFVEVLRTFILSKHRQWGQRTLLDYVQSQFASPIRIDVGWTARRLTVTACSETEARAAAAKLAACLKEYCATHVRLISNFPEYAVSRLLGMKGATIRQLEEATDTEITLVRDRAQVQVLNTAGDVEKLEAAVHAIRVAVFGDDDEDDGEQPGDALRVYSPTSGRVPAL